MSKLKVLFLTDNVILKTGFGRFAKSLLTYLYKTGKYELVLAAGGTQAGNPELARTPWKTVGVLPANPAEIQHLQRDPNLMRAAAYGAYSIDQIIVNEKPDVFFGVQDFWGIDFCIDKYWFDKITSVVWTTLDSLPILPSAVEKADKIKDYWVWSTFAEEELHRLGKKHVKTVHGCIDDKPFYKLTDKDKLELRKKNNLPADAFIIGDVFRNQLRKSVPNLLEGYSDWKKQNPQIKNTYLLLHTSFNEGWNIPKIAKEYNVNPQDILTTYICRKCKNYQVKMFTEHELNCPICNTEKGQITSSVGFGTTEKQLNEIYNLMDVFCHAFTSGATEIPIVEAKFVELITLVTNYSCGEEMCKEEAFSFPLDWSEYREHGTEFRKASTLPSSVSKQINKVYLMTKDKRAEMGKKARQWALNNFSVEATGKIVEEFLSTCKKTTFDFDLSKQINTKNPNYIPPEIEDDKEYLKNIYSGVLNMPVKDDDSGLLYWLQTLNK